MIYSQVYSFKKVINGVEVDFVKIDKYCGWWAMFDGKIIYSWIIVMDDSFEEAFEILGEQAKLKLNK